MVADLIPMTNACIGCSDVVLMLSVSGLWGRIFILETVVMYIVLLLLLYTYISSTCSYLYLLNVVTLV